MSRRTANCGSCGRFVGPRNFNEAYDAYFGVWEWDPTCDRCDAERKQKGRKL